MNGHNVRIVESHSLCRVLVVLKADMSEVTDSMDSRQAWDRIAF